MIQEKKCTMCGASKPATAEYFTPVIGGKFGVTSRCKPCLCKASAARREDPAVKLYHKMYKRRAYRENPAKHRAQKRAWAAANPDKIKEVKRRAYAKNAEQQKLKAMEWQRANPERARARKMAWKKSEKGILNSRTPANRVRTSCSVAVRRILRGHKAGRPWSSMVDYSTTELMRHLERQFTKGMSWDNYGEWHIDHILPLASFIITSPDDPEIGRAWSLANLRPLWAAQNLSKGGRVTSLL